MSLFTKIYLSEEKRTLCSLPRGYCHG